MKLRFLPLSVFLFLCLALAAGLALNPRHVPSPLLGKPAPEFSLAQLNISDKRVSPTDFKGKVWVLNVWASWCVACLEEHPLLTALLKDKVLLVGLNYKDKPNDARQWLSNWGDPYQLSLVDEAGVAGLDWGVYGVPETFVIDASGIIRHKHIGPLTSTDIEEDILPLVRRLESGEKG